MKPLTTKQEQEIKALQNFATSLGLKVNVHYSDLHHNNNTKTYNDENFTKQNRQIN